MDLKYEETINDVIIKYYDGFNYDIVNTHDTNGKDGMMIIFVEKWNNVLKSLKRDKKIDDIFQINSNIDLNDPIPLNNWVVVYQYDNLGFQLLFDIVRDSFKKIPYKEWNSIVESNKDLIK